MPNATNNNGQNHETDSNRLNPISFEGYINNYMTPEERRIIMENLRGTKMENKVPIVLDDWLVKLTQGWDYENRNLYHYSFGKFMETLRNRIPVTKTCMGCESKLYHQKEERYSIVQRKQVPCDFYECGECCVSYYEYEGKLYYTNHFKFPPDNISRVLIPRNMDGMFFYEPAQLILSLIRRNKIKSDMTNKIVTLTTSGMVRFFLKDDNNYLICRAEEVKDIPFCNRCRKAEAKNPVILVEDNEQVNLCDKCRDNWREQFFGVQFKKLKGRTNKLNPFERMVGIELEIVGGNPFTYFSIPKELSGLFKSVYDGSIYESNVHGDSDDLSEDEEQEYEQEDDPEHRGAGKEIVTIPMARDKLVTSIYSITDWLKKMGWNTNKSCGYHCHFDMTDETIDTVRKTFLVYSIFEDSLFNMLPASRRTSRYCLPIRKEYKKFFSTPFEQYWYDTDNAKLITSMKKEKYQQSRYVSINYHALFYHGTLENRQHSGTINPRKIMNWIMINQILIDYAKNTDMKTLLSLSGSNTNLIRIIEQYQKKYPQLQRYNLPDYIADRIEKFKEQTPEKPIRIKTELKASKIEEKLSEDDMGDFIGTML
jgi:hypothetical protein